MPKYIDLEITINDTPYPITRTLRVPAATDLHQLHYYIQLAMGWELSHLHLFTTTIGKFTDYFDDFEPSEDQPEFGIKITDVLPRKGSSMTYLYDFGDDWKHTIRHIGSVIDANERGVRLRNAIGACPKEDSGGVWNLPQRSTRKPDLTLIQQRLDEFYRLTVTDGEAPQPAFCKVHGFDQLDEDTEQFRHPLSNAADQAMRFHIYDTIEDLYGFEHLQPFDNDPFGYRPLHIQAPPVELAKDAPIVRAVMPMLIDMLSKQIKYTSSGYLPVKYVKAMFAELSDNRYPMIRELQRYQPSSESVVKAATVLRHILLMSGLVETTKTTMGLTLKGLELVAMRDYAQLYLELLEATLRKFNWGCITYSNECPLQQSAAPIMLLQSSLLLPQTPVSDEMLYDLLAGIVAGIMREPIERKIWHEEDEDPRKLLFRQRYCYFFGLLGIWEHEAKPNFLAAITESRQISVTELGRSLIGFEREANVR
ncbi:plasmid pRiA4b ORF-3 family protein [Pseudidiomarina marina]|uniref:Plasmid pRiA4b Orf3-like domain-containing protein n=1 Tax=Pseudidiomarina marina TaxID=502366 RepID=A0A432YA93_9GAMM|nr:plasmid pRiA4b ORF-3 family protein [Pseudidiomarina marina]RUO57900.1 hypothetical protein CWI76_11605 [Pseudidiomarina marina]